MDPVEQVITHVLFADIVGTVFSTALAATRYIFLIRDRHVEEWCQEQTRQHIHHCSAPSGLLKLTSLAKIVFFLFLYLS